MYLLSEPKSSFLPLLKPKIIPAAMGNPEVEIEECVANSDAVSLTVCIA